MTPPGTETLNSMATFSCLNSICLWPGVSCCVNRSPVFLLHQANLLPVHGRPLDTVPAGQRNQVGTDHPPTPPREEPGGWSAHTGPLAGGEGGPSNPVQVHQHSPRARLGAVVQRLQMIQFFPSKKGPSRQIISRICEGGGCRS